ncbi:protein obstructor-E-like [Palaemon carinicauda]|uniref:protein obstructor-E-like n=1 Tax=Palaemon carinicauda TaxID=392227 RepID=UPI0035B60CC7
MTLALVVSTVLLACANGQEILSSCPSPNGFFADAVQCDKYYQCQDNVMTEKLCPDGMAFNDLNPRVEKCDFLFQVNCKERPDLQSPKPTDHCPRQNGYFPHEDPKNCGEFYYCTSGISSALKCPETLVFSIKTGNCGWPDGSGRSDCATEKQFNFTCPKSKSDSTAIHPRYADPDDCQFFYVCINGETPRRNGCTFGQVFDAESGTCADPKDVLDCSDYYTEYFENYFSTLQAGARPSGDILSAARASGYEVPEFRDRVRIRQGEPAPTRRGTTPSTEAEKPEGRPIRTRRPGGNGGLRRKKRPTTTTTTTTTPPPEYYDDYYYYEDYDNSTKADGGSTF